MAASHHIPTHRRFHDLTGRTFGRISVVSYAGGAKWNCQCSCGISKIIRSGALRYGDTKSCGCLRSELVASTNYRHGGASRVEKHPLYEVWSGMLQRCLNENNESFKNYGGRGITVCERWQGENGFRTFLEDMGERPTPKHTVERIDNNQGYSPSNCKWGTRKEQGRNKRNNRVIEYAGRSMTLAAWAEMTGLGYRRIVSRLARGWPIGPTLHFRVRSK